MPAADWSSDLKPNEALISVESTKPETDVGLPWGPTLRKVEISDAELDRLRRQVGWIAGRLAAPDELNEAFAVDSVTLHVGLTASGTFVWASAGVEVAVDVTWRRAEQT
jgi:hypothetical protein